MSSIRSVNGVFSALEVAASGLTAEREAAVLAAFLAAPKP